MSAALTSLTAAFNNRSARARGALDHTQPVAVTSWPTVPVEIIRAAGLRPFVIRGGSVPTPLADAKLEPDLFPNRLRQLVEAALAGQLGHAACVVLPRTSDPDYKAFLYLRELIRRDALSLRAPVLLFDLLQSDGPDVYPYNTARTRELFEMLATLGKQAGSIDDVRDATERANAARAAVRRLLALRRGVPRVSGAEVLPLIGSFWCVAPDAYAALANEAADLLARRTPVQGPRVLLAGAPVDGPALHEAIEAYGAVVVAEPGPWGSEAAGEDVIPGDAPFAALAEHYRRQAIGPRMPRVSVPHLMRHLADDIDAVVVVLPPDDTAFGWDYPVMRAWLEARHLPHVCLFGDPAGMFAPEDHERLAALVASVTPRLGVRHG
jgi:benzoyl-CoA reductase/2-hydroxyglutaryl-CoA dehydratase subunit BcrC/BadD/HgdB